MIITHPDRFVNRHIGPTNSELNQMLRAIGVDSLDQLINETVPENIRLKNDLDIPEAIQEHLFLKEIKQLAAENKVYKSYIGMGYYNTILPTVILRNIFENPGWYTQYTPYQAEIAQGRLEALLNFQTVVSDLTGLPIANASLLDEGTAAAEAMNMVYAAKNKKTKEKANRILVDQHVFPQTLDILHTRALPQNIQVESIDWKTIEFTDQDFAILLQYPASNGAVEDYKEITARAKEAGVYVIVAADLLGLALLTPPGEWGADVVVGNTQRFGVPMGFGGPHAAYFATVEDFKRQIPGRIIGISIDSNGMPALRMALQTREQHIRRDKATSNICTAQALLAIIAGMYAVYHGPKGIKQIATRVHGLTQILANSLAKLGFNQTNAYYFDTLNIELESLGKVNQLKGIAAAKGMNFYFGENNVVNISLDESTEEADVMDLLAVFAELNGSKIAEPKWSVEAFRIPEDLVRSSDYLQHEVFNSYHSESQMLRYMKSLETKDLSLTHSMISLGSCTMKLNATTQLIPVTWQEFGNIHPFAPENQVAGYTKMIEELEQYLCVITGFDACSLQPNSGAQGEYAGLLTIRAYHESNGDLHRNIAMIPSSAHGTNPASAVMAGMKVVVVKCDTRGNIDVVDLREKAEKHADNLAALMVTYPSTHGVFEESIKEICGIIHEFGGKVYMDGANMNAQVGLTSPAEIGADVCHLNLHKTFSIPHGGGGPGMGPICVNNSLAPFLPGHQLVATGGNKAISAVSSAPFGSASILLISYAYIRLLGKHGLKNATEYAILNANYIKARLEGEYDILFTGANGRCAHEMIVDLRPFKKGGVEAEDVAKRLVDYGFHAPTMSFPVAGTIMIEPTESEDKAEMDRFCDALLEIRKEIEEVVTGEVDAVENVLKNAPHTVTSIVSDNWDKPYSMEKAAFPLPYVIAKKFWPSVGRVNNTHGDRNLICTCPPVEAYVEEEVSMV